MIKKQNEESFAASSLNSKSMAYDDFQDDVDQAIAHFQKLNATQKERYLDAIQQKMNDAATGKGTFGAKLHKPYQDGAGAPDAAERNRKFNREEFDFIEWENDLADTLEAMGFTKEAREKAAELFYEAIENRLFHADSDFQTKIKEILNDFTTNPFTSDETLDVAEQLANRIEELEAQIAAVEAEKKQLMKEILSALPPQEEPLANEKRAPKRSTVEDHLFEANEDNADNLYNVNEREKYQYLEPNMRAYMNAIERTNR
jgi:hypothetical protein